MLYAIFCYDREGVVGAWPKEKDDALMTKNAAILDKLEKQGRLGPVARLMPTSAATTVRPGEPLVLDGPFAETKEQLLGFYVIDCETLADATEAAEALAHDSGAHEIRPIRWFRAAGDSK